MRWRRGNGVEVSVKWRLFELGFCLCSVLQKDPFILVQEKVISINDGEGGRSSEAKVLWRDQPPSDAESDLERGTSRARER